MRKIVKQRKEPKKWTEYCCTPGVDYQAHPELRRVLLTEQGYICAYCMSGLDAEGANTKIEHMKSRELHPEMKFKYKNMVICCSGVTHDVHHCDTSKDGNDISFDLMSDPFFTTLKYKSGDGTIISTHPKWNDEINNLLNLNNESLKKERKVVLDTVIEFLGKREDWNTEKQTLRRLRKIYDEKDARGHYKPYCGVVVYFLDKRLERGNNN